jgi:hypothetical protein
MFSLPRPIILRKPDDTDSASDQLDASSAAATAEPPADQDKGTDQGDVGTQDASPPQQPETLPRPNRAPYAFRAPQLVRVFSRYAWSGARAGVVVRDDAPGGTATVRVLCDTNTDAGVGSDVTLSEIPVFENLSDADRGVVMLDHDYWAECLPRPSTPATK